MMRQAPARVGGPRRWSWGMALALSALGMIVMGIGLSVQAAPAPESLRNRDQKDKANPDDVKKDAAKKLDSKEAKKGAPGKGLDFPLPSIDIEKIFKNLPPGAVDPAQMERMKKDMQKMREHYQKMMEEMGKNFPGGFPGGGFPPGEFPNFPGGQGGFGPMPMIAPEGRLGARVEKPSDVLIDQLDLPKKQGLVIREVRPDSAAAKAGIKANDILLEINGKPVPNDFGDLVKQLRDVKAGATVDAVVLRRGKKETIKGLTLPETKLPGIVPPGGGFPPNPGQFAGFPAFPPGAFPGAFPAGVDKGITTTVNRSDDKLQLRHREGNLSITVQAQVDDGKTKVSSIHIQDGDTSTRYESLERVPEQYRDRVRNLIELGEKASGKK